MPQPIRFAKQFDAAVARARARAGTGWDLLSPALREALVAREVLAVLSAIDEATGITMPDVHALCAKVLALNGPADA